MNELSVQAWRRDRRSSESLLIEVSLVDLSLVGKKFTWMGTVCKRS